MADKNKDNNNQASYITYGVAFGLIGGSIVTTIVGLFLETPLVWAFGPGLGMLIGIIIGSIMDLNKR